MKYLRLLLLTPILFLLSSCYRTDLPSPPSNRYYFTDDFNNNVNGWEFDDPLNYAYGWISGGTYKIEYLDDYFPAYYISQDFGFDVQDNFIIETRFGSDNEMGLLFGFDDRRGAYGYSINIDYDGYIRVFDEGGNGYGDEVTEIYPSTRFSSIRRRGDWNTVRIEQRGNKWIVTVNGTRLFDMPAQNLRGRGVGYVLSSFTSGEVDYLDIAGYRY